MTPEIHAPTRGEEWRCACSASIRAASCRACQKCGMSRPYDPLAALVATNAALHALDVFDRALEAHGNRVAAMAAVIEWLGARS